jgi:hypothetical protein
MLRPFVLSLSLLSLASFAHAENISTRFGTLSINNEHMLLYKNRPLNPEIHGNNSLSVIGTYQLGSSDVVLIRDNGGSSCPAQFYFVTTSASGVKASSAFGTCTDLIEVKPMADSILVTMRGFRGPAAPQAEQRKSVKEKHVYVFKAGALTENGKPVK